MRLLAALCLSSVVLLGLLALRATAADTVLAASASPRSHGQAIHRHAPPLPTATTANTPTVPLTPTEDTWTSFSTSDGLASDSTFFLYQSPDGSIWVATNQGISILSPAGTWQLLNDADGLADNQVSQIVSNTITGQGHWIATDGGVNLLDDGGTPLDKSDDTWVTFRESDGLSDNAVSSIGIATDNRLWFGTSNVDPLGFETGSGIAVLDTAGTLFNKTDDSWITYTVSTGDLASDIIRDIERDRLGAVWVATASGLHVFYEDTWATFNTTDGLADLDLGDLLFQDDLLWIATRGGISVLDYRATPLDKTDDQWLTFDQTGSELTNNNVTRISSDDLGRIWISMQDVDESGFERGYGVNVLDTQGTFGRLDDEWASFVVTTSQIITNVVRSVLPVSGNQVYISTNQGLNLLDYGPSPFEKDDDSWTRYSTDQRIAGNSVQATTSYGPGSGLHWLGTNRGLNLLDYNQTAYDERDDTWLAYTSEDGFLFGGIQSLTTDQMGRLWMGTSGGLTIIDPNGTPFDLADDTTITYQAESSDLVSDDVQEVVIDTQGRALIASGSFFEGGVQVLDIGDTLAAPDDDTWTTYTADTSALPSYQIRAIDLITQTVWAGTSRGLARLDFTALQDTWQVFTTGNSGLAFDNVRAVAGDAAGNIWAGLLVEGLSVRAADGTWTTFTQDDGLANNSITTVTPAPDGTIWIGTDNGISVLDYNGTLSNKADDSWTTYNSDNVLLSGSIRDISIDARGQVWVGTEGGGASVFVVGEDPGNGEPPPVFTTTVYLPLIRE